MLAAALGGLDAFVFTAGIGENSATIRARIAEKLAWLGAELDPAANAAQKALISRPDSRVALCVVPTDEELMIARHTLALLPKRRAGGRLAKNLQDDWRRGHLHASAGHSFQGEVSRWNRRTFKNLKDENCWRGLEARPPISSLDPGPRLPKVVAGEVVHLQDARLKTATGYSRSEHREL